MSSDSLWRWTLRALPLAIAVGFGLTLWVGLAPAAPGARAFPDLAPDHPELGRRAYAHCLGCHGVAGQGIPGYSPSLTDSAVVLGSPASLAHLLLNGAPQSPRWNQHMPAFKDRFSNAELAALLSLVRSSWGNAAPAITAAEIAAARRSQP